MRVVLAHDYLTQRGGAERVVLSMAKAFPGSPLYTSLFDPDGTFPEFRALEVRPAAVNRFSLLRRHHRLAFPLLAPMVTSLRLEADVLVCSSSGWAHGIRTTGRKLVYCHAPARWLYQTDRYVRTLGLPAKAAARALGFPLRRWDRRVAATASSYVVASTHIAQMVEGVYGRRPHVLPPPPALRPDGATRPLPDIESGFILCVSRLLPYKNVDAVVDALALRPRDRLVLVGSGPDEARLRKAAGPNVRFLSSVSDEVLRWLYSTCAAVVAASYEDFGLTPLEAASFGKPAVVLRFGGFRDTVRENETGLFFDVPTPDAIAAALAKVSTTSWDADTIRVHAAAFSEQRFIERLRSLVADEEAR
jgi:glycosyltransferase involved in cell wall biosynthesis